MPDGGKSGNTDKPSVSNSPHNKTVNESLCRGVFIVLYKWLTLPSQNDFVRGYFPNVLTYLTFEVNLRSPNLWVAPYSEYQTELHHTISEMRDKGRTFDQIATWLNENNYPTTRGRTFRSPHVHSIMKKKRIRDERLSRECQMTISNFNLRFVDTTLVNSP